MTPGVARRSPDIAQPRCRKSPDQAQCRTKGCSKNSAINGHLMGLFEGPKSGHFPRLPNLDLTVWLSALVTCKLEVTLLLQAISIAVCQWITAALMAPCSPMCIFPDGSRQVSCWTPSLARSWAGHVTSHTHSQCPQASWLQEFFASEQ